MIVPVTSMTPTLSPAPSLESPASLFTARYITSRKPKRLMNIPPKTMPSTHAARRSMLAAVLSGNGRRANHRDDVALHELRAPQSRAVQGMPELPEPEGRQRAVRDAGGHVEGGDRHRRVAAAHGERRPR